MHWIWITCFYSTNIQMIIDNKDHNGTRQKPNQLLMHNNVQVAQPNYNTQLLIIQQTQVIHNIQTLTDLEPN